MNSKFGVRHLVRDFKYFEMLGLQTIFAKPVGKVTRNISKSTVPFRVSQLLPTGFFMPKKRHSYDLL